MKKVGTDDGRLEVVRHGKKYEKGENVENDVGWMMVRHGQKYKKVKNVKCKWQRMDEVLRMVW